MGVLSATIEWEVLAGFAMPNRFRFDLELDNRPAPRLGVRRVDATCALGLLVWSVAFSIHTVSKTKSTTTTSAIVVGVIGEVICIGLLLKRLTRPRLFFVGIAMVLPMLSVVEMTVNSGEVWSRVVMIIPFCIGAYSTTRYLSGFARNAILMALALWSLIFGWLRAFDSLVLLLIILLPSGVVGFISRRSASKKQSNEVERKSQLARELHDAIGHHLTAFAVQINAASAVATQRSERAFDSLVSARACVSTALDDLREIATLLETTANVETTTHGVALLEDELSLRPSRFPFPIDFVQVGTPRSLAAVHDHTIYRIVQEALTNVSKHAERSSRVVVTLNWKADDVEVLVHNDGRNDRSTAGRNEKSISGRNDRATAGRNDGHRTVRSRALLPLAVLGGGQGLTGMQERVRLLGGTFRARPTPDGWTVRATLPRADFEPGTVDGSVRHRVRCFFAPGIPLPNSSAIASQRSPQWLSWLRSRGRWLWHWRDVWLSTINVVSVVAFLFLKHSLYVVSLGLILNYAISSLQPVALLLRRRFPEAYLMLLSAGALLGKLLPITTRRALTASDTAPDIFSVAFVFTVIGTYFISLYSLTRWTQSWWRATIACLCAALVLGMYAFPAAIDSAFKPNEPRSLRPMLFIIAWIIAILLVPLLVGAALRIREARNAKRLNGVRRKLAEELRELIGNQLSGLSLLATGAIDSWSVDRARSLSTLDELSVRGSETLRDLRRLVGILRTDMSSSAYRPRRSIDPSPIPERIVGSTETSEAPAL